MYDLDEELYEKDDDDKTGDTIPCIPVTFGAAAMMLAKKAELSSNSRTLDTSSWCDSCTPSAPGEYDTLKVTSHVMSSPRRFLRRS